MLVTLLPERAFLFCGDCLDFLSLVPANSVDAIITDPPYGLEFMGKEWDGADGFRRALNINDAGRDNVMGRLSKRAPEYRAGPLFQQWCEMWGAKCLRVLKPGAHLLAFGGARTYHRLACAIEDAGFEIRDQVQWLYGQGFPKSANVGNGWGTGLKPAAEPIVLARKPFDGTVADCVRRYGTGALNIEMCRVETVAPRLLRTNDRSASGLTGSGGASTYGKYAVRGSMAVGETTVGRWPANVVHDGSDEVLECFPDAPGQQGYVGPEHGVRDSVNCYGDYGARPPSPPREDQGSAARFFYCAKASKAERGGSKHPTIKPVALMRWLTRLVTPAGGLVLDPFAGTGSTGIAAVAEGFRTVLCEKDVVSQEDIRKRFEKP